MEHQFKTLLQKHHYKKWVAHKPETSKATVNMMADWSVVTSFCRCTGDVVAFPDLSHYNIKMYNVISTGRNDGHENKTQIVMKLIILEYILCL